MPRHRRLRAAQLLIILALGATLLAACGNAAAGSPGTSPTAPGARDLEGTSWRGILVRDVKPLADAPPTIRFEAGQASGTTGCNTYGGAWTLKPDGTFSIASMVMTEMACDGARGTQEQIVLDVLSRASRLELLADGTIRISGAGGAIVFARVAA